MLAGTSLLVCRYRAPPDFGSRESLSIERSSLVVGGPHSAVRGSNKHPTVARKGARCCLLCVCWSIAANRFVVLSLRAGVIRDTIQQIGVVLSTSHMHKGPHKRRSSHTQQAPPVLLHGCVVGGHHHGQGGQIVKKVISVMKK